MLAKRIPHTALRDMDENDQMKRNDRHTTPGVDSQAIGLQTTSVR